MNLGIVTYYTPNCSSYACLSDRSKQQYADKFSYKYFKHTIPFNNREPIWNKPQALLHHFTDVQVLVWVDADAIIANYEFDIASIITDKDIYMSKDVHGWNNGVFALKTSAVSKKFLQSVIAGYEFFRSARFKQQSCMGYLLDTVFAQNICEIPAKVWNCYDPVYRETIDNPFIPGDFILHLPNERALNRVHANYRQWRFNQILKGDK